LRAKRLEKNKFYLSNRNTLILMAIPCVTLLIVFSYMPLYGWIYAFFDYQLGFKLRDLEFIGFQYIKLIFNDTSLFLALRNTMVFSAINLGLSFLPAAFAILLNEFNNKKAKSIIQTITTFPYFISWVLVFSVYFLFLSMDDGFLNRILVSFGFNQFNFLASENATIPLQTFIGMWKSLGFSAIIYMASISGIDSQLYDAAAVDGAGRRKIIRHITIPSLIPTYFTLLLLSIGNILSNGFEQYYLFQNALVYDRILVLDTYLYKVGIQMNLYSFSTALGMTKTLVSLAILFSANKLSKIVRGTSII